MVIPTLKMTKALQILREIKGKFTDENILKWRNICCVNPDISNNNESGICRDCPIAVPPKDEKHGWCHDWWEASIKLSLRHRLEKIEQYIGKISEFNKKGEK